MKVFFFFVFSTAFLLMNVASCSHSVSAEDVIDHYFWDGLLQDDESVFEPYDVTSTEGIDINAPVSPPSSPRTRLQRQVEDLSLPMIPDNENLHVATPLNTLSPVSQALQSLNFLSPSVFVETNPFDDAFKIPSVNSDSLEIPSSSSLRKLAPASSPVLHQERPSGLSPIMDRTRTLTSRSRRTNRAGSSTDAHRGRSVSRAYDPYDRPFQCAICQAQFARSGITFFCLYILSYG